MRSTGRFLAMALALAGLLALLTIGVVLGQDQQLGGKLLTGSDVTIPAGETVDHDVYVFGGTLTSSGTINGDIVAVGGNVNVNGLVNGDVLAGGGQVSINGAVSGDVRAAGGQVSILGDVSEDILATGGQVTVGGHVGQDLIVSSGQFTLTGSVAGSATGNVGAYSSSGSIAGTDSITVTGNQGPTFLPLPRNPLLDAIRQFIAVLLVALLAWWLVPRGFGAAEAAVRLRPLPSLGWGFVGLVAYIVVIIAVAVVVLLLAIGLAYLGFAALLGIDIFGGFVAISGVTLAFVIAVAFLGDAIVGLALARFVSGWMDRSATAPAASSMAGRDRWSELGMLAVGVAIVVAATSLPIVGPWVKLVVVLLGLGSVWLAWRRPRATMPGGLPASPVPPAPPAAG